MTHASLFSGIGGFDLAAEWAGWINLFNCEIDPFCQQVLKYHFPNAEQHKDIYTTDFTVYRGRVDVLSGGFPCQPFSVAGKRQGTDDERHLWPQMLRAIREIKPSWVVGENVRGIVNWSDGLVFEQVCADLEIEGYEVQPFILPACALNAPHRRERVWFIAHRTDSRAESVQCTGVGGVYSAGDVTDTDSKRLQTKRSEQFTARIARVCTQYITPSNGERFIKEWLTPYTNSYRQRRWAHKQEPKQRRCGTPNNSTDGEKEFTANTTGGRRGKILHHVQSQKSNGEFANSNGLKWDASNSRRVRWNEGEFYNGESEEAQQTSRRQIEFSGADSSQSGWRDFPTQSPICSRDDGLSTQLDGITFPKWRGESIKAYGNAVVPQLVLQIFNAINQYKDESTS